MHIYEYEQYFVQGVRAFTLTKTIESMDPTTVLTYPVDEKGTPFRLCCL
jgi:hypothetical protein